LGQRTSSGSTKYYYDSLYQLTRVDYPAGPPFNGESHRWTYDAIGNRLTNTVNDVAKTYAYFKNGSNPLNGQRLQSDGTNSFTFDDAGSLVTKSGTGGTFTFSNAYGDHRLRSISGAVSASYAYDYTGRRASKTVGSTTTSYTYDGQNLV